MPSQGENGTIIVHEGLLPSHPLAAHNRPGSFNLGLSDSGSAFGSLQGGHDIPTYKCD